MELSEYGITLETKELRKIIKGEIEVRKCPDCRGQGESWTLHYVLANDPKETEEFKEVSESFATNFTLADYPEYSWGECYLYECDTCTGVGYIIMGDYD